MSNEDNIVKLTLRLPENLHQKLSAQASASGVSLNQYVNDAIYRSLKIDERLYDYNIPAIDRLSELLDAFVGVDRRLNVLSDQIEEQRELFTRYMIGSNYLNE